MDGRYKLTILQWENSYSYWEKNLHYLKKVTCGIRIHDIFVYSIVSLD